VAGVAFALAAQQDWLLAVLIPVDVLFLALFVNFSNDYFDHKSGVDKLRFEHDSDPELRRELLELFDQKLFWSGNSLDRGIITEGQGKVLMAVLVACAVVVAIPIILYGGWTVVLLGIIALLLAFFYTAPPVNLGARGFGETDVLVSFSMIAFFSYYVIVPRFDWTMLFLALAIGTAAMIMRISDATPGYASHVQKGERDLVVRIGLENVTKLEAVLVLVVYAFVGLAALAHWPFALLFLAAPIAFKALRVQRTTDRLQYWRPIPLFLLQTVALEVLTVVAVILRTWTY